MSTLLGGARPCGSLSRFCAEIEPRQPMPSPQPALFFYCIRRSPSAPCRQPADHSVSRSEPCSSSASSLTASLYSVRRADAECPKNSAPQHLRFGALVSGVSLLCLHGRYFQPYYASTVGSYGVLRHTSAAATTRDQRIGAPGRLFTDQVQRWRSRTASVEQITAQMRWLSLDPGRCGLELHQDGVMGV